MLNTLGSIQYFGLGYEPEQERLKRRLLSGDF
jgi:hypothetical protein